MLQQQAPGKAAPAAAAGAGKKGAGKAKKAAVRRLGSWNQWQGCWLPWGQRGGAAAR